MSGLQSKKGKERRREDGKKNIIQCTIQRENKTKVFRDQKIVVKKFN